jgi:hypothetical protein
MTTKGKEEPVQKFSVNNSSKFTIAYNFKRPFEDDEESDSSRDVSHGHK